MAKLEKIREIEAVLSKAKGIIGTLAERRKDGVWSKEQAEEIGELAGGLYQLYKALHMIVLYNR